MMKKWKWIACAALVAGTVFGNVIVTDPIEDSDGWLIYKETTLRIGTTTDLAPTVGTRLLKVNTTAQFSKGDATKDLGITLAAGTYTMTFDVGINDNGRPLIDASRRDFGFFDPDWVDGSGQSETIGDSTNNTAYVRDALPALLSDYTGLTKTLVSTVDPAVNSWSTWTLTYDVAIDSTAIGQAVNFGFYAVTPAGGGQIQFDNLAIDYAAIPEPAVLGLVVFAGMAMLGLRRFVSM